MEISRLVNNGHDVADFLRYMLRKDITLGLEALFLQDDESLIFRIRGERLRSKRRKGVKKHWSF